MKIKPVLISLIACLVASTLNAVQAEVHCELNGKVSTELKLPLYTWRDSSAVEVGNIVAIPGLVFNAASYDSLAKHLAAKGYNVYGLELRGSGRWRGEAEAFSGDSLPHYGQSRDDLVKLLQYLRANSPDLPTYLVGESFGANMAIWSLSTHAPLVDGAILSSPSFKQCIHPKVQWPIDFCKMLWHPHKPYSIKHYVAPYISENKELRKQCAQDPEVITRFSAEQLIKAAITSRDSWKKVDAIPPEMPLLVLVGKKDAIVKCSAIPRTLKLFGTQKVALHMFPKRGHLLLEHQAVDSNVEQVVDSWLTQQGGQLLAEAKCASASEPGRAAESDRSLRKALKDFWRRTYQGQTYSACVTAIRELPMQIFQR